MGDIKLQSLAEKINQIKNIPNNEIIYGVIYQKMIRKCSEDAFFCNQNGTHFQLNKLPKSVIKDVVTYVDSCLANYESTKDDPMMHLAAIEKKMADAHGNAKKTVQMTGKKKVVQLGRPVHLDEPDIFIPSCNFSGTFNAIKKSLRQHVMTDVACTLGAKFTNKKTGNTSDVGSDESAGESETFSEENSSESGSEDDESDDDIEENVKPVNSEDGSDVENGDELELDLDNDVDDYTDDEADDYIDDMDDESIDDLDVSDMSDDSNNTQSLEYSKDVPEYVVRKRQPFSDEDDFL